MNFSFYAIRIRHIKSAVWYLKTFKKINKNELKHFLELLPAKKHLPQTIKHQTGKVIYFELINDTSS